MRYCIDLDETLCITPYDRDYSKAQPIFKMIRLINKLYEDGEHITIYTARGSSSGIDYHDLNVKQLEEWGVKYHELIDKGKPSFDILVDDKAVSSMVFRRDNGVKITGLVASCFDLLHAGHCLYLKEAKKLCDHLIAGLQTEPKDRSWKNIPIQSLKERFIQLEACRYVDEIFIYDSEYDLNAKLELIKPDIRVVGSDADVNNITGKEFCGAIYIHDRSVHNWSTSELRRRIMNNAS